MEQSTESSGRHTAGASKPGWGWGWAGVVAIKEGFLGEARLQLIPKSKTGVC